MTLEEIKHEVIKEVHRAQDKFPWWPKDIVHAVSIAAEEMGELEKASLDFCYQRCSFARDDIRKEALQVAAMIYRLLFYIEAYEPGGSGRFEE